ncbi:hypothetical protein Rsub_08498 [Raphidocelis subcapitata]|uniref:C3H1-type domain-containing protein n=1 Tax=Raphidocelis subcapitata TaxID=307507 RepID=A0A2V0PFC8_9CHLO|nr:hypothetical protein Rsub_08498 [Raphidocelis subcapitata]|eukprot:GBF95907.1 hypothetical protein Rsub_08498 [Raphidocelis subcapitata]
MAPKKAAPDKTKIAAKQKQAEDKTFGLKNKNKSAKVAKFVQQDKKAAEEERQRELNSLFAVAIKQPKVPLGVDPKSMVCEFFRHGQCQKGFKCKFSHDLNVERKTAKIDIYTDRRGDGEGEEGMDEWDQETLEKVVNEKHGAEKPVNATNIICKFFLDAVEKRQYGWFWKCPNGGDCKYRHALPPGYVLKSQMKELLEEERAKGSRDVAEIIEEERAKVEARTPITAETFAAWHAKKAEQRRLAREEKEAERRKKGVLNGREIFMQEGFTATDDAGAADDYDARDDDEEVAINEMFAAAARQQAAARAAATDGDEGPSGSGGGGDEGGGGAGGGGGGGDGDGAGPSTSGGVATTLTAADAAVFDSDSGESDDLEEDDEDDDDDDDLDPAELEALEAQLQGARV